MAKSVLFVIAFAMCAVVVFGEEEQSRWEYFSGKLLCGKKDPRQSPEKCHKYGTDSGFKCCFIQQKTGDDGICRLVSYGELDKLGIKGDKKEYTIEDEKISFSCKGSYLKQIATCVIIALVGLVMF